MSKAVLVNILWWDKIDYIWETGSVMIWSVTKNALTYLYGFEIIVQKFPMAVFIVHDFCIIP